MRDLAERNLLLRRRAEMPEGMTLVTDYFRDGWHRLRTGTSKGLEKKIRARNWHLIRTPKGITTSGTGMTSQQAVASAMNHALAEVCPHWNAIEVADIQSTQYPWFWLARIRVETYRIQQSEFLSMSDEVMSLPNGAEYEMERANQSVGDQRCANSAARLPEMAMSSSD